MSNQSEHKYQIKKLGFGIRVVNTHKDIVEGIWNTQEKEWFDVQAFINGDPA
jgi:gamma-glutamyl-gamma-aminobutyrate hydrolase PuuD